MRRRGIRRAALRPCAAPKRGRSGFTLLEVLVALAVIGIAVSVFTSLYVSSLDLSYTASDERLASEIASARLAEIVASPGAFRWLTTGEEDMRFPIQLTGEDPAAGNPVALPAALPAEPASYRRQEALFDRFRWEAFGKLVPGGAYYEVTVVVRYTRDAREQLLAMTSAVPVGAVPSSAIASGSAQE